eukprot:111934-Heterocapsa_arctica.AAC.1
MVSIETPRPQRSWPRGAGIHMSQQLGRVHHLPWTSSRAPRAPVACALVWFGWQVVPVDTILDRSQDLSLQAVQRSISAKLKTCDAAMWAPDCSTLSRARERPIPGNKSAPKPLRAADQ